MKFPNLPAAGSLTGAEIIPLTQSAVDKRTTAQALADANESKSANIASAATTDIGAATTPFVHITGTTTVTALGTVQAGTRRRVVFDGALTMTHNATSLILPTGANITTAANDVAVFVSEGSGNWRCVDYQRADGQPLAGGGGGGDVVGPASSTDDHLAMFNGTTGKLLQQGGDSKHVGSLEVYRDDGTQADISATTYGVDGGGILHGRSARGTKASPTAILSGDNFGGIGCRAYHSGGAFQTSSPTSIHWIASENQTTTAYGSYLRILTTPKGSTTRQERVIVSDNGTLWCHGNGTFDPKVEAQTKPNADILVLASASGGSEAAAVGAYTYGTGTPGFRAGAAGGTAASPTATSATRILAFLGGHGHDGTSWSSGTKALVACYSAEAFTASAQGTYITFETTPTGSTTRAEVMRLGPSARIGGDFSNATLDSRLMFQTTTANGASSLGVVTNGTGTNSGINLFGGSSATNVDQGQIVMVGGTEFRISSTKQGTGTTRPMTFYIESTEAARFDTSRNLLIQQAGSGLRVKEGSNAKQGTATLVAGAVTVSNTSITANSRIFLTSQSDGGTPGFVRVSARSAGANFTITSSSGTDTSVIAYEIFEPS